MAKVAIALCAMLFVFLCGFAVARADFGWFQYSTPCVPTAVAMTDRNIAVTCPDDKHVYIKQR